MAHLHKIKRGDKETTIDAIIYHSAQNGNGKNIALFGEAAVVEGLKANSHYFFSKEQSAIKVVEGSLASHEVSGVTHAKHEVYTPDPKPDVVNEDEVDRFPF